MEKINIAELLKGCPKGMELDCTMFDNVTLFGVNNRESTIFPIRVLRKDGSSLELTKYGQYADADFAKCVIFPKGKTTWEGFHRPFKDGDVVAGKNYACSYITIFRKFINNDSFSHHVCLTSFGKFNVDDISDSANLRFATEEEKQKLFQAIKDNGYHWNADTKTLEKLIKPKFKVGDRVKRKDGVEYGKILSITDNTYDVAVTNDMGVFVPIARQDEWELLPNKFDISTLKPFDKVLVRDDDSEEWTPNFYGYKRRDFQCVLNYWKQCIPYEGNEYLLGTIEDCDEFYKTWV